MTTASNEVAVFGGGCFWCTEAVFLELRGVKKVMSGYAGGAVDAPSYGDVSGGGTGHAEVIWIEFDASLISYEDLLEVFFAAHDPTTLNRQGNDIGSQYRSVIFYTTNRQKAAAEQSIRDLAAAGVYSQKIVTQILPLQKFYPAEEYHQNYYAQNSDQVYCQIVISPKLTKVRQKFSRLLRA